MHLNSLNASKEKKDLKVGAEESLPSVTLTKLELFCWDPFLSEMKIINQIEPTQLTIRRAKVNSYQVQEITQGTFFTFLSGNHLNSVQLINTDPCWTKSNKRIFYRKMKTPLTECDSLNCVNLMSLKEISFQNCPLALFHLVP